MPEQVKECKKPNILVIWGERHWYFEPELLQPWPYGLRNTQHRSFGQRRHDVYRFLR